MYIMCVCLFSALSRRVGALQISIIIIIIITTDIKVVGSQPVQSAYSATSSFNSCPQRQCRQNLLLRTTEAKDCPQNLLLRTTEAKACPQNERLRTTGAKACTSSSLHRESPAPSPCPHSSWASSTKVTGWAMVL